MFSNCSIPRFPAAAFFRGVTILRITKTGQTVEQKAKSAGVATRRLQTGEKLGAPGRAPRSSLHPQGRWGGKFGRAAGLGAFSLRFLYVDF